MYFKRLHRSGHTRRFAIRELDGRWEVVAEADDQVVKQARYDDWHRVERARLTFGIEVAQLEAAGWVTD